MLTIEIRGASGLVAALAKAARQISSIQAEAARRIGEEGVKVFEETVNAFDNKPSFFYQANGPKVSIGTSDETYILLSEGASNHYIYPVFAFRLAYPAFFTPKTAVGQLKSSAGGKFGPIIYRDGVWHPGFQGRHYDELVHDELERREIALEITQDELRKGLINAGLRVIGFGR